MPALIKINEVSEKYNITKRTLRYYEEIGLLKTVRIGASNSRYFDEAAINRLEQILLLKNIKFSVNEISRTLLSEEPEFIFKILNDRLNVINTQIDELNFSKAVISSLIKMGSDLGINNMNIYQLLKDQMYISNNNERMKSMEKIYDGDIIRFEFGLGLIPIINPKVGESLIEGIREMRSKLEMETSKKIPLIRVLDNAELAELEYRISIKEKVTISKNLSLVSQEERIREIVSFLKSAVLENLNEIAS